LHKYKRIPFMVQKVELQIEKMFLPAATRRTHTLWLAGCVLLINCKTHLALLFVVQTGVAA